MSEPKWRNSNIVQVKNTQIWVGTFAEYWQTVKNGFDHWQVIHADNKNKLVVTMHPSDVTTKNPTYEYDAIAKNFRRVF